MANRSRISLVAGPGLIIILALLLMRQLVWSFTVPYFQAPDEIAHIQMAAQMDRHGIAFYHADQPTTWRNFEESFDIKNDHYRQRGMIWNWDRRQAFAPGSRFAPNERELLHVPLSADGLTNYSHMANTYGYPPLYYYVIGKFTGLHRIAGATLVEYQFSMRIAQAIICTLFYFLVALIIRRTVPDEPMQSLAFICIAFHPLTTFMGSVVNNDNGLMPAFAISVLGAIQVLKTRQLAQGVALFGAGGIMMALTKPSGMLYMAASAITLAIILVLRFRLKDAFWIAGALAIVWLSDKSAQVFTGGYKLIAEAEPATLSRLLEVLYQVVGWNITKNIFGQFAWFEVNYFDWVYYLFAALMLVATIVLLVVALEAFSDKTGDDQRRLNQLVSSYFLGTSLLIVAGAFAAQFVFMPIAGVVLQGRYMLPAIHLAFVALGVASCCSAFRVLRATSVGVQFSLATLCVLGSAAGLPMVIYRFYYEPAISAAELLNRLAQYKPWYAKTELFWIAACLVVVVVHLVAMIVIIRSLLVLLRARHNVFELNLTTENLETLRK